MNYTSFGPLTGKLIVKNRS